MVRRQRRRGLRRSREKTPLARSQSRAATTARSGALRPARRFANGRDRDDDDAPPRGRGPRRGVIVRAPRGRSGASSNSFEVTNSFVDMNERLVMMTKEFVMRVHVLGESIMARPNTGRPTDQELEILKVLWEAGPSTVRDVWKALSAGRNIGYTS